MFVFLFPYITSKLENSRSVTSGSAGPHVHLEFCQYAGDLSTYVDYRQCPAVTSIEGHTDVCQRFSVSFTDVQQPFKLKNVPVLQKI